MHICFSNDGGCSLKKIYTVTIYYTVKKYITGKIHIQVK